MAATTAIEWTDKTWNPIVGCSIVSPGCTNCYAMSMAARIERMAAGATHYAGTTKPSKAGPVWTGRLAQAPEHILTQPLRWRKPARIFVNSMGDLFHDDVPDDWIDKAFAVMALAPQHTFQVLTKRAERMRDYMLERWQGTPALTVAGVNVPAGGETGRRSRIEEACEPLLEQLGLVDPDNDALWTSEGKCKAMQWEWPLPNVWLGVSAEDQARADQRIPYLLATPAAIRFVSAEPLLGPLTIFDMDGPIDVPEGMPSPLHWIIAGGESGRNARPAHPDWFRSLRDQCDAACVPFFFKQWGTWVPLPPTSTRRDWWLLSDGGEHGAVLDLPDGRGPQEDAGEYAVVKTNKKTAGNTLDGRQHLAIPQSPAGKVAP